MRFGEFGPRILVNVLAIATGTLFGCGPSPGNGPSGDATPGPDGGAAGDAGGAGGGDGPGGANGGGGAGGAPASGDAGAAQVADAAPTPDALPPDNTSPDVFFGAPFDGAAVSGVVQVQVEATDDRGVAEVVFALDGADQLTVAGAPYTWSWDTAGLVPGPYLLTATATDEAGNAETASIEVHVAGACRADGNCPPADVSIITPVAQAVVCGQMNIEAAATDDDLNRIEFTVDGRPVGVAERAPYAVVWSTEGFDNGEHTIVATAIDSADQRAFARVQVEVRNEAGVRCQQAPNIHIVQPDDGAFLTGQVPLEADASDDGVVVGVEFSIDNGRLAVVESVPWRSVWDTDLFDEGVHTVKATATDDTDATATTQVQVTVDRTAPALEIVSPADGETFSDRVAFTLNASDNLLIEHLDILLDGRVVATLHQGPWEGELDTSGTASGDLGLSAVVYDKVGLSAQDTVDIRIDRRPTVTIQSPFDGELLQGGVNVTVSADDDLGIESIELYVDGEWLGETFGDSYAELWWEPEYVRAPHALRAVATDTGGQTAEAIVNVTVDHPFEVTITSPRNGATVADTITVEAQTRDDDGHTQRVELFVDGNLVASPATAPYRVQVDTTALADGQRRVRAHAVSDIGSEAEATVTMLVDNCDRDDDGSLSAAGSCGGSDCDDDNSSVNPDADDRVGDGTDQNCDRVDGADRDGDGFASVDSGGTDCNDNEPRRNPGLTDTVGDGLDNNCDSMDGVDTDGDGSASVVSLGDDCNDGDSNISPDAPDLVDDGVDQNCDGVDGTDADRDGYASVPSLGEDCDDGDPSIHPCADDRAGDGIDQNCDAADVQSCDDCDDCSADTFVGPACNHVLTSDGGHCDDGNACTQDERCQDGICSNGVQLPCADDGDACTVEFCDPAAGCTWDPAPDGIPCPDGSCRNGECCAPSCDGRICGDDGCGGSCGDCDAEHECDGRGACVAPTYLRIDPGVFTMGSPAGEPGRLRNSDETQHQVRISRPFLLKATEVTQSEWQALMGNNPSNFVGCGRDCPVDSVSWYEVIAYLNALSATEGLERCFAGEGGEDYDRVDAGNGVTPVFRNGLACRGYRLPTEAEWEYAARAGTSGGNYNGPAGFFFCDLDPSLAPIAWYCGNGGGTPHPVAAKGPNDWRLYDMLGNVWEWTWDWYDSWYPVGGAVDPVGPAAGVGHVFRGGGWNDLAQDVRAANRDGAPPDFRHFDLGFRPARSLP